MAKRNTKDVAADTSSRFKKAANTAGIDSHGGKRALKAEYRNAVSVQPDWQHTESIDMDAHLLKAEPNAPRWDYGLGIEGRGKELVFWVEPHPASSTGEVKQLVEKVEWLRSKLALSEFESLRMLTDETTKHGCVPFCWVHSGALRIVPQSKEARMLARAGIGMPTRHLKLPAEKR